MKFSIFSAALSLCCATASYAGDNNSVFVMQDSTVNPLSGNSLFIDQSDASNASIGGTENGGLSLQQPARQIGGANTARLIQSGDAVASAIGLTQTTQGQTGGNDAEITVLNGGTAILEQLGVGNSAILNADLGGSATLLQDGDGNFGSVRASRGASGRLEQIGDNNDDSLEVSGQNVGVSYTLRSNNATTAATGAPVQVISNTGGSITIQQRTIGSN